MRRISLVLSFLTLSYFGQSQDWKSYYDRAVSDFQAQHYPEAMATAEKAYDASKTLEPKSQSYSLQLLTAICLEVQDYSKGIPFANEEVSLFGQIEGAKSKRYAEAVRKRGMMYQALSNWPEARKDCEELLLIYSGSPGIGSLEYAKAQNSYGQVLMAQQDYRRAADVLGRAIIALKKFPNETEEYLLALYFAANADAKNKDMSSAELKLKEFISLIEKNNLQSWPEYGQAKTQLVQIADAKGDTKAALALVQQGQVSEDQKAHEFLKAAVEIQNTKPAEALRYFKLAEESLAGKGMESNTGFSVALNHARCLFDNKQFAEAQIKWAQAKNIATKLYAPTSVEYGFILELEGDLMIAAGNLNGAEEKYTIAFVNFSALPPGTRVSHRSSAATKFLNLNHPDLARKILEGVTTDYPLLFSLPEKNQLEASSLYSEVLLQLNLGNLAIDHLSRHLTNNNSPAAHKALTLKLAEVYQGAGNWKKSESLLESLMKKPDNSLSRAEACYQMARLHQLMGKYKEAEINYRESIDDFKRLQSAELNQVYNSFATFYITLGNYAAAETIYQNLLNNPGTPTQLTSAIKQNLATVYQQTLRYDKAEQLLKEVLESDRKTIGEKHPDFAISLQNLAALYQEKGNLEKASQLYMQALEVDKLNGGDQTLSYASKEANLGTVYQETNQPQKARLLFESSLKIRERLLGTDHPDYMYNVYNLAVLHEGLGENTVAADLFKKVSGFYLKQIKEIFPSLSEFEKTAYLNKINKVIYSYEQFVVLHQQNNPAALADLFTFRLETKALLLNASMKVRAKILNSGNADLQAKFSEWLQLKEKLVRFASLTLEEKQSQQKVIEENQQKANELEKWLSTQSELFGGEFSQGSISTASIKGALKPGEAAVEMIRLNPDKDSVIYAALVLTPERATPSLIVLSSGYKLEGREFSYYSNTIRFDLENERSYSLFWKPLEGTLKNVNTIYFSADGVYNKINLLTLFDVEKKQYLIERLTVRLLSNLREMLETPGSLSSKPSATLFGFPDFRSNQPLPVTGNVSLTRNMAVSAIVKNGVADLPGTKEEVINIAGLLKKNQWGVISYMNKEASEEKVKSIQSPDVLHIATHGFFIPEKEGETSMVYSNDISLAFENPLTRSGLLLAGVEKNLVSHSSKPGQEPEEDGILTALEVMNLNLDHTDLVILSACETGSGKIRNGEGVYGLQRAFLVSGANNLIMSLWKVSDEATQELMLDFYSQWLVTKDKVSAFRQAQLELKKKYDSPFYWGAFVMIGR